MAQNVTWLVPITHLECSNSTRKDIAFHTLLAGSESIYAKYEAHVYAFNLAATSVDRFTHYSTFATTEFQLVGFNGTRPVAITTDRRKGSFAYALDPSSAPEPIHLKDFKGSMPSGCWRPLSSHVIAANTIGTKKGTRRVYLVSLTTPSAHKISTQTNLVGAWNHKEQQFIAVTSDNKSQAVEVVRVSISRKGKVEVDEFSTLTCSACEVNSIWPYNQCTQITVKSVEGWGTFAMPQKDKVCSIGQLTYSSASTRDRCIADLYFALYKPLSPLGHSYDIDVHDLCNSQQRKLLTFFNATSLTEVDQNTFAAAFPSDGVNEASICLWQKMNGCAVEKLTVFQPHKPIRQVGEQFAFSYENLENFLIQVGYSGKALVDLLAKVDPFLARTMWDTQPAGHTTLLNSLLRLGGNRAFKSITQHALTTAGALNSDLLKIMRLYSKTPEQKSSLAKLDKLLEQAPAKPVLSTPPVTADRRTKKDNNEKEGV